MIELRIHQSLRDIPRPEWDLLAAGAPPFLSYPFLEALETCGCVGGDTGWHPMHLTLWENEQLVAAAPAYLKGHSEGEFVFDYAWAEFAQRMRVRYYPKLVVAVPFTPVTGPRVLVRDESQRERMVLALAEGVRRFVDAETIWARTCFSYLGLRQPLSRTVVSFSAGASSTNGTTRATPISKSSSGPSRRRSATRSGASGASSTDKG